MPHEPNLLLVFPSIHQVLSAEKKLKSMELWCDMIPTPREVSSDCGMSLAFDHDAKGQICELMKTAKFVDAELYILVNGKYVDFEE